jgi:GLPGLI family protein
MLMKNCVVFFLFILIPCLGALASGDGQKVHYEVRYELSFQPDSNNADLRLKEDMLLWIGLERSMFISYLQYFNDSVFYSLKGLDASIKSERIQQYSKENSRFKFHLFKDFVGKTISDDHYIFGSMYKYSESISDFRWQLRNEYEEYHGYRCQKATTYYGGRHWEVWFAAEIPISDGPYKFAGLPGLILKARDTRSHYVFELVHIRRAEPHKKIYEKDSRPFYVNRCQFLRALQHHNQNIGATVTAGTVNIDPQKVKEIEERFKKRNNHIELKCD